MHEEMKSEELTRMVRELREKGWTDTEILEHILKILG